MNAAGCKAKIKFIAIVINSACGTLPHAPPGTRCRAPIRPRAGPAPAPAPTPPCASPPRTGLADRGAQGPREGGRRAWRGAQGCRTLPRPPPPPQRGRCAGQRLLPAPRPAPPNRPHRVRRPTATGAAGARGGGRRGRAGRRTRSRAPQSGPARALRRPTPPLRPMPSPPEPASPIAAPNGHGRGRHAGRGAPG